MLQVSKIHRNKWAFDKDEKKYDYVKSAYFQNFDDQHKDLKILRDFFDYLEAEDFYRYSKHYYRYLSTMASLAKFLPDDPDAIFIETGGASPISEFLSAERQCYKTTTDLRLEIDAEDDSADIIFSFEVLEHIKDKPEKSFDEVVLFRGSGVQQFAAEVHRVLKPGGLFIMTTPNPCSCVVFERFLEGKPPMVFRPHVREYTRDEILEIFQQLNLVHHTTLFNFFNLGDSGKKVIQQIQQLGGSTENRGDDHFFVLEKAANGS